jgi:hypothetical protein
MLNRLIGALVLLVCLPTLARAVDGDGAAYIGGTLPLRDKSEGKVVTTSETALTFTAKKKDHPSIDIPYAAITELEYGQKAGRRVGVAIMVSPVALFSKKRNHYLTITYTDGAGRDQTGVFELGKDIVRTTLKIVQVRSGKPIVYQDDEARKSGS